MEPVNNLARAANGCALFFRCCLDMVVRVAYIDWLTESLRAKLAEQAVGEPVALRGYFQIADDHGLLISTLAAAVAMAETWFDSRGPTVYAQGGVEQGSISVLATFPNGRTAVLSSDLVRESAGDGEGPSVTLLLIGNHGTMQFNDRPGSDGLAVDLGVSNNADQERIVAVIEDSLRSGGPAPRSQGGRRG